MLIFCMGVATPSTLKDNDEFLLHDLLYDGLLTGLS